MTRAPVVPSVGQRDRYQGRQVDNDEFGDADERQAACPACHTGREAPDGPEPQV